MILDLVVDRVRIRALSVLIFIWVFVSLGYLVLYPIYRAPRLTRTESPIDIVCVHQLQCL